MKNKILTVFFAAMPLVAVAQTAEFESVVDEIMSKLTNVRTLDREYEARIAALDAENSLPGAEAGFTYKFPQQSGVENRWGIEVSQEFEMPGAYSARRKAAGELRRIKSEATVASEQWLRYEIEDRLLQFIEARKRLTLLREAGSNLDGVIERSRQMLEHGQITILDLHKAEFEQLALKEKIAVAEGDCERLKVSAGFGQTLPQSIDRLEDFPATASAVPAVSGEEIELAGEAAAEELAAGLEKMKRMPSFSVGYVHDFEEGIHFNGFSLGIALPAYKSGKSATAARLEAETAQMKLEEARAARAAELSLLSAERQRLDTLIEEYDKTLTDSNFLGLLKKSFDAGQISMTQFLLDQNQYLSVCQDQLSLRLRRAQLR